MSRRIAVLCGGSYVSGLEINALNLMEGLKRSGYDLHCITGGWTDGDFPRRLDALGISSTPLHFGKITKSLLPKHLKWTFDTLVRLPGALLRLRKELRCFRPDVVLLFNRDTALAAAGVLRRYPCVLHQDEVPASSRSNRLIYRTLGSWIGRWVAVSECVAEGLREVGVPACNLEVIYNGVREPAVQPRRRAETGIFTIVISGQVAPWKGHHDLLEALRHLSSADLKYRCLIFGKGDAEYLASLKAEAAATGVGENLEWRGFANDQDEIYREADVVVVPTRSAEPFGLVAAEAGIRELPVVASRGGGLKEVVADGETGFLVEPGNPIELAHRLTRLAADPALRRRMGEAGAARVRERFTAERMVAEHVDLLSKLKGQAPRGGR